MIKWPLDSCRVVGGMRPSEGKAPFARGAAVLDRTDAPGSFLQVHRYTPDEAEGDRLDLEEWEALQVSRQGTGLATAVPARAHTAVWIARSSFLERESLLNDLSASGALLGSEAVAAGDAKMVVVREDLGNPVRDKWAMERFDAAWTYAREARWSDALRLADLAFVLSRGLVAERVALLALAMERQGRKTGGEGLIDMAAGSRGAEFGASVRAKREELAKQSAMVLSAAPSARKERRRAEMHKANVRVQERFAGGREEAACRV
jgi:hypothetical protein